LLKGTVFVHLGPRHEGVSVPTWLRGHSQLVLQVGLDMPIPIADLRVDGVGVYGTLSFSRQPFTCIVPWDAVFAMSGDDGKGMVWPESMPPEVAAEVNQGARRAGLTSVPPLADDDVKEGLASRRPAPLPLTEGGEEEDDDAQLPPRLSLAPPPVERIRAARRPVRVEAAPDAVPEADARPEASQPPAGKAGSSSKPPRKLPPYLRIVK